MFEHFNWNGNIINIKDEEIETVFSVEIKKLPSVYIFLTKKISAYSCEWGTWKIGS